jgi:WD40 repeat protein
VIVLQGARGGGEFLLFSPDGGMLVAGSSRGLQVWNDLPSGGRRSVLPHRHVSSAHFTPDGRKLLLNESLPRRLVLRDLPTRTVAEVPLELTYEFRTECDLAPDGRTLVAGQVEVRSRTRTRVFCRSLNNLTSSLWSADTDRSFLAGPLFIGGERFVLFEWWCERVAEEYQTRLIAVTRATQTGAVLSEVTSPMKVVRVVVVVSSQRHLIAARQGMRVKIFRADDLGVEAAQIRNDNRKEFTGLAFHPSGRYLAAISNDATVKFYDTVTWTLTRAFDWDIGRLRSIAFSPDGMLAAAGGDKGKIVVWDVDL